RAEELTKQFPDEGTSGIALPDVMSRSASALIEGGKNCLNALDSLRSLKKGRDQQPSITPEEKEQALNLISVARAEYDEVAKNEVQKAFVYSFEESARTLLNNYLEIGRAHV